MNYPFERHHGVMVRRLYFGLRDAGLRPGQVDVLCSLAKHFTVTVSPSTREDKWIAANCQRGAMKCWGVNLQWSGIPSRRESSYSQFLQGNRDRLWLGGPFDLIAIFFINLSLAIITEAVINCIKRFWFIVTSWCLVKEPWHSPKR